MADHHASDEAVRLLPSALEGVLHRLFLRLSGLCLLLGGLIGWLALVSWSKNDPSFSTTSGGDLRNLVGDYGAVLSDLMVQTVGLAAAFVVAAPVVWGLYLIFDRPLSAGRWRVAAAAFAVLFLSLGLASIPKIEAWPLVYGFGGLIGDVLYNVLGSFASPVIGPLSGPVIGISGLIAGLLFLGSSVGIGREDLQSAWQARNRIWSPSQPQPRSARSWFADDGRPLRNEPVFGSWPAVDRDDARDFAEADVADATPVPSPSSQLGQTLHADDSDLRSFGGARLPPPPPPPPIPAAPADDDPVTLPRILAGRMPTATTPSVASRIRISGDTVEAAKSRITNWRDQANGWMTRSLRSASNAVSGRSAEVEPGGRTSSAGTMSPPAPPAMPVPPQVDVARFGGPHERSARSARYRPPSIKLLVGAPKRRSQAETDKRVLQGQASLLEDVLGDYGVQAKVLDARPGPVVTLYEIEIARGIKASRVIGLADDIARSMSASSARVAVVPRRNTLGIELPNVTRESVALREIIASPAFGDEAHTLPIALGTSIDGQPVVADLARMPHLLVAGTTGSGKSVGVNAMILSLLYTHGPDRLRLLMVDPKMLELSIYNGIPHLLTPVITDPHKAVSALNWAVREMEERYKKMSELSVRNIASYNHRLAEAARRSLQPTVLVQTGINDDTGEPMFETRALACEAMPHIVIVVDEFADLMVVAGKEIEASLQRLAQMARAAGIHLIMATQRPSVDVVTGTIKANFPARIAFKVASKVDSRTILNTQGAEQLLGQGDMLLSDGTGALNRVHGAFVSDEEVESIVAALRRNGTPVYVDGVTECAETDDDPSAANADARAMDIEGLYAKAVAIVLRDRKASTSYIQRRLSIGYNRAADLIERMEQEGVIGPAGNAGKRDILLGRS